MVFRFLDDTSIRISEPPCHLILSPSEDPTTIAYATQPGSVVRRHVDALRIEAPEAEPVLVPLHDLERLVVVGRAQVTSDAIRSLLDRRVPTTFLTRGGRLVGTLLPPSMPVGGVRRGQLLVSIQDAVRLSSARRVVRSKIVAMRRRLAAWRHNHSPLASVDEAIVDLDRAHDEVDSVKDPHRLFGHEGAASRRYWFGVSRAIDERLGFRSRRGRPALDPVNAMLSFGYALLRTEVQAAVDAEGLDPWTGVHHVSHGRRPALVLDLMEPWRHRMVDKLVMTLVNRQQFGADDFHAVGASREDDDHGTDGVRFRPEPLRRFIQEYELAAERPADDGDRPFRLELHEHIRRIAEAMARHGRTVAPIEEMSHDHSSLADDTAGPATEG